MSSKVLLKRKMLSGWFDLLISFLMDMSRTWFDIDFLFDKDVVGLIWCWLLFEEDISYIEADLKSISNFCFFLLRMILFHLSRCRRSRGWTASFTGEPGRGISREFARWVELVGFWGNAPCISQGIMLYQATKTKIYFSSPIISEQYTLVDQVLDSGRVHPDSKDQEGTTPLMLVRVN